jgi:GNAT superfamily N-acetyltransferase
MTEPLGMLPKYRTTGAVPLIVEELDPSQISPGSTLRPHRRYSHGGASIVLGLAEVYQQAPLVWALARWRFEDPAAGRAVLEAATAPGPVYVPFNAMGTPDWALRRELLEAAGYTLDYEKMAIRWEDNGQPLRPASLTVSNARPDVLIRLIDICQADTRDRVDARWPVPGGRYLAAHPGRWLVLGNEPVGFVGLTPREDEPDVAMIALIGVLSAQRGHGYGAQLVEMAYAAARQDGYRGVFSLVDVVNEPSRRSLTRRGAVADAWHRYVYVRSTI